MIKIIAPHYLILSLLLMISSQYANAEASESQLSAVPKTILWQESEYKLSWSNYADEILYLEYLKAGDTTDSWENIVTVQLSNETMEAAVKKFIEISKPFRTEDVRLMKNDQTGEILMDTVLLDAPHDFIEHNLIKLTKGQDGRLVKVYFQTRLKLLEAAKDNSLVANKIGKPRGDRLNFLSSFIFFGK